MLLDPYLHRAAADAFSAGQYTVSLGYVAQIVGMVRSSAVVTPYFHWAHTIAGLDHLAKGEVDLAVSELNLSSSQLASGNFIPSMALASALAIQRPDAVASYLDAVSQMGNWPQHAQALVWKAQVLAGHAPNLADLSPWAFKDRLVMPY